jgi:hypothetical protein
MTLWDLRQAIESRISVTGYLAVLAIIGIICVWIWWRD